MAWWRRWVPERKGYSSLDLWKEIYGGRESKSGRAVNLNTAIKVATVFCCLRVLGDGVAQVPWKLMRRNGRNIEEAEDHPLYWLLYRRPNEWQTSFEYRETLMLHAALYGNHYSYISRAAGKIIELLPFEPGQVTVKRYPNWRREYIVRAPDGSTQTFPQESIWHVRGPSWNGWMGLDILDVAREVIGLSMGIDDQQASLIKNGVQSAGVYAVEGNLTDEQHAKLTKWIKENHEGPDNAGKTLVLDRAAKWLQKAMSNVDAQTLESRRYQVEEVCRPFRVIPIMVGYSDKNTTYASAEQMFLAHVVHTLSPWYERIQQSTDMNLLSEKDQKAGIYSKLVVQGLLRGALRDTAMYLKDLASIGIITRNEARDKLDMNPIDGLDEPLTPANIVGNQAEPPPAEDAPASAKSLDAMLTAVNANAARTDQQLLALATRVQPAPHVEIQKGAIAVNVAPAPITISEGAMKVAVAPAEVHAEIHNAAPPVVVNNLPVPDTRMTVERDDNGDMTGSVTRAIKS